MEQTGSSPEKGWARESILRVLLKKEASLSQIASEVGISKSTASYHMKALVKRGIAELVDVRNVKGGVYLKTFALRRGKVVISEPQIEARGADRMITAQYERLKLSFHQNQRSEDIIIFLYDMFLLLSGAPWQVMAESFLQYGMLFGKEILGPSLHSRGLQQDLQETLELLSRLGIAFCTVETRQRSEHVISCSTFFRTSDPSSPVFKFFQGTIKGALDSKHGERFQVQERIGYQKSPELLITRRRGVSARTSTRGQT